MNSFESFIQKELESIKAKNRYRSLRLPHGIDLSSNDYLCLSKHPKIISALKEGLDIYGAGSGASRLIRGHRDAYERVESEFAAWVGSEDSLFLANGFAANLGLIDALSDPRTIIFTDRLNHASILDGIRISGAVRKYYNHRDMNHLRELLQKSDTKSRKIIVSETVFSMDGDLAYIPELIQLKKEFDACLILDEAHALGVFGEMGAGVAFIKGSANFSLSDIDFRVYTGGKSLGLEGALIACSNLSKEFLINKMRTFIFSTAPMPIVAHALRVSIELAKSMNEERRNILENANLLRKGLREIQLETMQSESQIVPVVLYEEEKALKTAKTLQEKGFDIRAIRPPTVKESRLRISINANLTKDIIFNVLDSLKV
jgi:8-amino-7-oxononanoate synthase